ncbi:flagellar protein FlgN [Paenibacillus macerans]|uniref:Flagellar protein FlgN n=1 Tax=Paenibacillus macerans TaxID=44252 RepID=A0A6N8EZA0_PAEMA|nr:flagellar protein FlgN [Paenibacillus macerans]MUG23688.1 flagellar protein FlgN [Paenibacillus macerans]
MAIQQLIDVLASLDDLHRNMLEVGEVKKSALVRNDIEKLIQVMNQESKILKQIEQREAERIEACQAILLEKGIKSRLNLTVTELTRLVFDTEEKQKLQQVQSSLSQTLEQLKRLNELNQKLIEQSLTFIDYSLGLFGGETQEATYQHPSDKSVGAQRSGLFDTRA